VAELGLPAILKTRRLGYDGKGQARLNAQGDLDAGFAAMGGQEAILEGFVSFEREVSVIVARGLDGAVVAFDPGENLHEGGILRRTSVPARLSGMGVADAVLAAGRIVTALDYVGVMGVELFVTPQGLIVNEIAPRVHNSGHWTQQGCAVDQFEQHIRAVAGWPLGDGSRYADVVMENLIGDDILRVPELARERDTALHVYGKGQPRAGRKMGHVNRIIRRPS
jgi:5-(carboxyamino)imidazole ribonucleotide synthase